MYMRILVPLDGSPLSEAILPWVRQNVAGREATVYLLRVVPPAGTFALLGESLAQTEPDDARLLADAEDYLDHVAAGLAGPLTSVKTSVRLDRPADAILQAARELAVDFVAMSTHGHAGLARLVLGSVAQEVLRSARIPVVLIRPHVALQTPAAHVGRRPA